MSFFSELKRRNVFRVAAAYAVAAWVILQIADLVLENIGAPGWVIQALMLVILLGFVAAVIIAWAYEITPEGIKRESEVDKSKSITPQTSKKLDRILILFLMLAVAVLLLERVVEPTSTTPGEITASPPVAEHAVGAPEASLEPSIAVLPFVNMSADADNEYFSDGLSEELLNLLAKVDGLKVAARTSSFKFKNTDADIGDIGGQLNVATVLEGSVRKSGNQARITAQLIKVDDGFHLWSETYDRKLDNIFEVQDEIAQAIVDALKLPLLGHDAKPLAVASTESFAAYDLYLQGRHHARQYSEAGFSKAIEYYRAALEIDPSFAQALGGLADSYIFLADFGNLPQGEALQLARAAVDRALGIDPDSPEAHAAMGLLLHNMNQHQAAEEHYLHALRVNPNYVNTLLWYRQSLQQQYRNTEAMELANKAMNLDPLSMPVRRHYTHQLLAMNRYDEAENEIQAMIATNPDDPTPYEIWGDLFLGRGLPHKSIPMHRNAQRLREGDIYMAAQNVTAALQLGDDGLVDYWLNEARQRGADGQWTRFAENQVMYAKGDFDALLSQVDQLLVSQPGQSGLLGYRHVALLSMGKTEAAQEALLQAMGPKDYQGGQTMSADQMSLAVHLAYLFGLTGDMGKRDQLLAKISGVLEKLIRDEPPSNGLMIISAQVASVRNDLQGTLSNLESAVDLGFASHWELIRDPVFTRWQENEEFNAFYQGMLKSAASMLREYEANNPTEKQSPTLEVFN